MKVDPDKFQALFLGKNIDGEQKVISLDNAKISGKKTITIDSNLLYVSNLCKRAGQQLNVLMRLHKKLDGESSCTIYNLSAQLSIIVL